MKYAESKNKAPIKEAVEPIKNMVIQMMVDKMINPVFISKIAGLTLTMIKATYYPKNWNAKYEEDINKSIAQNDYYCYVQNDIFTVGSVQIWEFT